MKQTAFITGSSRGIGKAIALRLAKDGYGIILHCSKPGKEIKTTKSEIEKMGVPVAIECFDICSCKAVELGCKSILKKNKSIDILVNNAAVLKDNPLLNMPIDDWNLVLKTNLYGPFYILKQLLPRMIKNRYGKVINISSKAADGAYGKSNYSAAKAGLIALTKSVALEVAKYNINVNAVCPGYIKTEMSSQIPSKRKQLFLKQIAMGRVGKPSEVAELVAFLTSKENSYITGAVIDINGGWF